MSNPENPVPRSVGEFHRKTIQVFYALRRNGNKRLADEVLMSSEQIWRRVCELRDRLFEAATYLEPREAEAAAYVLEWLDHFPRAQEEL